MMLLSSYLVVHLESLRDALFLHEVVDDVVPADDDLHRVAGHADQLPHLLGLALGQLLLHERCDFQRVA